MSIDNVLARLEKVKKTGKDSYMACCPSHEDSQPSLSIAEKGDGLILMHCFGGCDIYSILSAMNLNMTDLFPDKLEISKRVSRPFPAVDVLRAIGFEALVVASSGVKILSGELFTQEDRERLVIAVGRIQAGINAAGVS